MKSLASSNTLTFHFLASIEPFIKLYQNNRAKQQSGSRTCAGKDSIHSAHGRYVATAPGRGLGDCSLSPLCSLCSTAGAWCRETLPGEGLFKEKHASLWNYSMKVNCAKPLFAIQTQRYNVPPGVVARRPWIHHVTFSILSLLCQTDRNVSFLSICCFRPEALRGRAYLLHAWTMPGTVDSDLGWPLL